MASTTDPSRVAEQLLKDPLFLQLFQRAMETSGGAGEIPKEGDPSRDEWLHRLQSKLQEETMKDQKKNLEQVHTDENGQWCYVVPEPGFCVKCFTHSKFKVFLNICKHEKIREPELLPHQGDTPEMPICIPLSCGPPKPETDKQQRPCKVYDVIISPQTLANCEKEPGFKRMLVGIAMNWIKRRYEPNLDDESYNNLNFKVKGTLDVQRVRLEPEQKGTAAAPQANAMQDEIKLPATSQGATRPTAALSGGGLVQEMESSAPAAASSPAEPQVLAVEKVGAFDWGTYDERPAECVRHPYFKEAVPAFYYMEFSLPDVSSIKEVEVGVSRKHVSLAYVDRPTEPFLTHVFDYPVAPDEVEEAKFVKTKRVLKLKLRVCIEKDPDATKHSKDAALEEEKEAERAAAERKQALQVEQERQRRIQQQEEAVLTERKTLVSDLAAVQSGELPSALKEEIDGMEKEQLVAFLHRVEHRVKKGDSVDTLLEKLPESVLNGVSDYVRDKLHLEPRAKKSSETAAKDDKKKKVSFKEAAAAETDEAKAKREQETKTERMEYNYVKQSEEIFGVAFHNRYLFALDSETLS